MATRALPAVSLDDVLRDPRYFPVHLDFARDRLVFVETGRSRLARLPFIDGRFPLATGAAIEARLSDALQTRWTAPAGPDRFIFHVGFCGSTLLATLLDAPGRSFAQREPLLLNTIADAYGSRRNRAVGSALGLARSLLRRPWQSGERNFCKPSNWANNLIPILALRSHRIRPLFLAIDGRDYLVALFRGGRERVQYICRATRHLLGRDRASEALWSEATGEAASGLEVAARIGLVSLHRQFSFFKGAIERGRWTGTNILSLRQLEEDTVCACMIASRTLGLEIGWAEINQAIQKHANRYAKAPAQAFSSDERREFNAQIESRYGGVFDAALEWAARMGLRTDIASLLPAVEAAERAS